MFKALRSNLGFGFAVALFIASAAGCTFKTPAPVVPVPLGKAEMVNKDAFFRKDHFSTTNYSDQRFLAAWAPIDEKGYLSERFLYHGVPQTMHMNIVWKITETALLGYEVNPSFAKGEETIKSAAIIEIPIIRHYHYEQEKDGYQRNTNRWIKNEARDAWMHRPYMDLDLGKIHVNGWSFSVYWASPRIMNVTDVVWDPSTKYFAFTVEAKDAYYPDMAQATFRFNFLGFEGTKGFKPTPVDSQISKHINVLHRIGRVANGDTQVDFAGKWDLSKQIKIHTYGVPDDETMDILEDSVEEWNIAYNKVGVTLPGCPLPSDAKQTTPECKVLKLVREQIKYPFDLRYPVINWVEDRRKSYNAPLGVGLAISDVDTGEIKYSSVTIWGGMLRNLINKYSTAQSTYNAMAGSDELLGENLNLSSLFNFNDLNSPLNSPAPTGGDVDSFLRSDRAIDTLKLAVAKSTDRWAKQLETGALDPMMKENPERAQQWRDEAKAAIEDDQDGIAGVYAQTLDRDIIMPSRQQDQLNALAVFHNYFSSEMFMMPDQSKDSSGGLSRMTYEQALGLQQAGVDKRVYAADSSQLIDSDRTFATLLPQLNLENLDQRKVMRTYIKAIVVHEIGHTLGLGHNFKGNILPTEGEVAQVHYDELKGDLMKKGFVASSIMDYYSGHTEVIMDYDEDIRAGLYDLQMLRFLYKNEYPAIADSANGPELKYFPIPDDGIVQMKLPAQDENGQVRTWRPGFLPACNDTWASYNLDPLCQRHDRGSSATEIMAFRFQDLNASLISTLNAFSPAKGGNAYGRENYLWATMFRDFSQIRVFYDFMRLTIDETSVYKEAFAKISRNENALFNFSESCIDPNNAPPGYKEAFAALALKDPKKLAPLSSLKLEDFTPIHDLCQANKIALDSFNELLKRKGHDFSVFDSLRSYVYSGIGGGEANWNRNYMWGTYKEIGSFPMRFAALYTVTNPTPVFIRYGLTQIPQYSRPQARYSYASLYPKEFSSIIDTAVKENLNFGGGETADPTEMGTSLLYMNYFLKRNFSQTKDNFNRFPQTYVDNLRSLSSFEITMSPVILTNVTKDKFPDTQVFKYKASYLDQAKRDTIDLPEAYLLPERRAIVKGNQQQIFMPVTRFRYLTDTWGYFWAIDLRYHYKDGNDPLKGYSVKFGLDELDQQQIAGCVDADGTGLNKFFNTSNDAFTGFVVNKGIATKEALQNDFDRSVRESFDLYYTQKFGDKSPNPAACDEAIKGIGLVVTGAALINGYWLPQAVPYLNY